MKKENGFRSTRIKGKNSLSETTLSESQEEILHIYNGITEYCRAYNISKENLLDILEDQKVLPMIRGKATEYVGAAFLKQALEPREWLVEKLNLNPQAGIIDEDASITFRRTGNRLKAETKNAVRRSFRLWSRTQHAPHFKVKCHKSRSHLRLQATANDRYLVGEFDLLLCNVSNALIKGKALESGSPLIDDSQAIDWLRAFYGVDTYDALIRKAYDDWRFCLPVTIANADGVIPRTPIVLMENDPNWFGMDKLTTNLRSLINGVSR